jgi:hypothetical protein
MFGRRFGRAYAIVGILTMKLSFNDAEWAHRSSMQGFPVRINALKPKKPLESNVARLERSRADVAKLAECNFFSFRRRHKTVLGRPRFRPSVQSWSAAFTQVDIGVLPFRDRQKILDFTITPPNFARRCDL